MISVLQMKGAGITSALSEVLFHVAIRMVREKLEKTVIRSPVGEGMITTQFKTAMMGFLGGIHFTAEVEHERGKTIASFIVDMDAVDEEGEIPFDPDLWIAREPGPESGSNNFGPN